MAGTKRTRAMAVGKAAPVSSEYVSDDGFVASDSDVPASKKAKVTKKEKPAPAAAAEPASDEQFHNLSSGKNPRRVNVSEFKGKNLVNIREYYEKDGAMLPGKKVPNQANLTDLMKQLEMLRDALQGISLTTEQFDELLKALPDIKKALGYADGDEEQDEVQKPKEVKKEEVEKEGKKDDLELTEKEKALVYRERKHPNTVIIQFGGKVYFVDNRVHDQLEHVEGGMEEYIRYFKDSVSELDEGKDGPRELYEAIIDTQYDESVSQNDDSYSDSD